MDRELELLRRVDFNWTMHLQSVWEDHAYHVDGLQPEIWTEFTNRLQSLKQQTSASSPLGWVITGTGGSGKTHLLSSIRAESMRQNCAFILVDMTDVHDFWETVAIGYTNSLQEQYAAQFTQSQFILRQLISTISTPDKIDDNMRVIVRADPKRLRDFSNRILQAISRRHRANTAEHQDTIRALIASNSEDFETSNLGQIWLQGIELDQGDKSRIGFRAKHRHPRYTVRGLSWIMSLSTPAVVAFDQLDPIVRQLEFEALQSSTAGDQAQEAVANSIISGIGDGLRAMYDTTQRTLVMLSCLESSREILQRRVLQSSADRFAGPSTMSSQHAPEIWKSFVASRLKPAWKEIGTEPPYPTWPFRTEAFDNLLGVTPRELLKRCYQHQQKCIRIAEVAELEAFGEQAPVSGVSKGQEAFTELDILFDRYRQAADLTPLNDEQNEDGEFAVILLTACELMLLEIELPGSIHTIIDRHFTGGGNVKPLHARVRLVMEDEEEREEHFSLRILQRQNAVAFQNRLKLAMTQAGIDQRLSFRHLSLIRTSPTPNGKKTEQMLADFAAQGGTVCAPSLEELRSLSALHRLHQESHASFEVWLRHRRPLTQMAWCRMVFGKILELEQPLGLSQPNPSNIAPVAQGATATSSGPASGAAPPSPQPVPRHDPGVRKSRVIGGSLLDDAKLPLGNRLLGNAIGEMLTMPLALLDKHAVVRAGSGSGKTVLLKRMIEEAALRGIPSIVIDAGNDMAALGDRWPGQPESWREADSELAERYHCQTETVVWTPGRRSANPLRLELIPDLRATIDDRDSFDAGIDIVSSGLADTLGLGAKRSDESKRAILKRVLQFFVEQGCNGLEIFIELLSDLPSEAQIGINQEAKLARELADDLRVLRTKDPLICDEDAKPLDPAILFGDDQASDRTRVSVISLAFLPSETERLRFVNRLAMTLFAWIKANPNPPGRLLRGLLVLDEAKDLIPSNRNTACKQSLAKLAAQARKYKLGIVFATQNPREIDSNIVGNCSTQFFGKANSSVAIDTVKELLAQMRGNGSDIGRLERGVFYAFNADAKMDSPIKVSVPMCLSHHRPLSPEEVLQRATPRLDRVDEVIDKSLAPILGG